VLTDDGKVVVFKKPGDSPTGDPKDFCWIPVYHKLDIDDTPKFAAAKALEYATGVRIKPEHFHLVNVESKPIEEYKCWMFVVKVNQKTLTSFKPLAYPFSIVNRSEIPHPQNWILNAYMELNLPK
jgi:hypothetical protein